MDHATVAADDRESVTSPDAPSAAGWFAPRPLIVAVVIVCVLLGLLWPLLRSEWRSANQRICIDHLMQIAAALQNYHDVYRRFPRPITYAADGTPMHSWRVAIVPYIHSQPFFDWYDQREPWNGPQNLRFTDEIPDAWGRGTFLIDADYFYYRCPGAPATQNRMCTNYVMVIDDRPGQPNGPPNLPGSEAPQRDTTSVIIIEIADSDILWMEPRDVLLSELSFKINDRSKTSPSSYHGGACVMRSDGSVTVLDESMTEDYVKQLLAR